MVSECSLNNQMCFQEWVRILLAIMRGVSTLPGFAVPLVGSALANCVDLCFRPSADEALQVASVHDGIPLGR